MEAVKTKPKSVKVSELKDRAEALGLTVRKMKKAEIIHAIQQAEGFTACFGESNGNCMYTDCYFMHDCFKNN